MYLEEEMQKLQASIDSLAKRVEYLEARNIDVILTAKQFSAWAHVNISQVYLWINSGQIETLLRLGKLHRIPLSQFYTEKGKMVGVTLNADGTPRRKKTSGFTSSSCIFPTNGISASGGLRPSVRKTGNRAYVPVSGILRRPVMSDD